MQSKWFFFGISLLSLALSILPELIPDKWKVSLENTLGNHYGVVWLSVFLLISISFIYWGWKQEKSSPANTASTAQPSNKVVKNKIKQKNKRGDNIAGNKIVTHQ